MKITPTFYLRTDTCELNEDNELSKHMGFQCQHKLTNEKVIIYI